MKHLERALDGQNQFWKYLFLSAGVLIGSSFIGSLPLAILMGIKTSQSGEKIVPNSANLSDLSAYGISQNLGFILMMLPFVLGLIVTIRLLKPFHNRILSEVINGTKQIRWKRFFTAFTVWFLISAIYFTIDYLLNPGAYKLQFEASKFLPLLLLSLIFIPFQTTYEELIFRGYLTQGIAAWSKNRWFALVIPALIFGLMHSFNPEVKEYGFWLTMPQYIFFGLLFGFITIMDDGTELAMGAHAANNLFLCLFITSKSSALQTPAVFEQTIINPSKETIILVILGIVAVLIFSRIYKWKFSILNNRVEKSEISECDEAI